MRIIDTYVFKENEEVGCIRNIGLDTTYKRKNDGQLRVYTKESVVDTILKLVEKKKITKGKKIENKPANCTTYVFNYTVSKEDTNEKHSYKIQVPNKYIEENKKYVTRLDAAVTASIAIKAVNYIKVAAIGTAITLGMLQGTYYIFAQQKDDPTPEPPRNRFEQYEDNTFTHQDFIDRMHDEGITDEEMQSWGMEIEEQEATKSFH